MAGVGGARFYPDGRPRGRTPGSRNKRTTNQLLDAKRAVAEARAQGGKLAKEVADDFMHIFANLALEVRPVTQREIERGVKPNPRADESKFKVLSAILLSWVEILIPYQSARFTQINVDVGELAYGEDVEEGDAMKKLERLLDAYAEADDEARRVRERDEEDRRFRAAREVVEVPKVEPEPDASKVVALRPPGQTGS
jgi:hypothetical protein